MTNVPECSVINENVIESGRRKELVHNNVEMTENRKCVRIFDWLDIFPDRLESQIMYIYA